jgi:ABC-type bacteriocin/lantibiotic exporter with double-glycine peptidase domain
MAAHHHSVTELARAHLRELMRLERQDLWAVLAFSVGAGLMALATPVAVQSLVNTIAFGMLLQPLVVLVLVLLGCLALNNVLIGFQIYVVEMMQRRIFVRLLGDIAGRLRKVSLEALDGGNTPELVNRFFDVMTVQKSGANLLLDGLAYGLQTLIGMLLLAFYHPILLAFDLLLIGAVLFILFILGKRGVLTAIQESKAKYAVAAWLEDLARNTTLTKWAGGQDFVADVTDRHARHYLDACDRHFTIVMRQQIGILVLHTLANTSLLGLGGWMVIERQLTLGQLIAAELIVSAMLAGLSRLGKSLTSYYELMAGMDKLGHLLDLPVEPSRGEVHLAPEGPATLNIRHVNYRYEQDQGRPTALSNAACTSTALIGSRWWDPVVPAAAPCWNSSWACASRDRRHPDRWLRSSVILTWMSSGNPWPWSRAMRSSRARSWTTYLRMGRPRIGIETIRNALTGLELNDTIMALPEDSIPRSIIWACRCLPSKSAG